MLCCNATPCNVVSRRWQWCAEGTGLSQGQKQRILIARAIYRNPDLLLLDEATNSLDAFNERVITEGLRPVLKGRTAWWWHIA